MSLVKSCLSKRAYLTYDEAIGVAKKCMKDRDTNIRVYYCENCCMHHLTSKKDLKALNDKLTLKLRSIVGRLNKLEDEIREGFMKSDEVQLTISDIVNHSFFKTYRGEKEN